MTDLTFATPWILALAPVLIAATVFFGLRAQRRTRFARVFTIVLRSIGLCLLILAMAGTGLSRRADITAHLFALDLSDSAAPGLDAALAAIRAGNGRTDKDAMGIIAFGADAVVEKLPTPDGTLGELYSWVDGSYSNLASALTVAQSAFPEGMKRRVVLVSDGLETIGNALTAARTLRAAQIEVDVLPLTVGGFDEVQLVSLTAPRQVSKNAEYELETSIYSTTDNRLSITVYKNNRLIAESDVTVRAGENRFAFTDVADEGGGIALRAEIRASDDRFTQNNRAFAYSYVADAPKVLVIGYENSGAEITKILQASGVNVTLTQAAAAPSSVDRLNAYDSVVLADAPLDILPDGFADAIESYARNTGGGVLCVGGENSYALGGYYNTPLETLLPVEMRLKDMEDVPNLGMIIVLDRSGSMTGGSYGVSKLELAKEAVIRAVDALSPEDTFGVIAFDDGFDWAVHFSTLGKSASAVQDRIAQISPGGGTSILPGLTEAVQTLVNSDTKLKHIILLTDGQAEQSGYNSVLSQMKEHGITLSSIAVGSDSDTRLLEMLAEEGGGRYYYTDEFTDLPKIFTKETTLAGKTYLNQRSFYPALGIVSPILTGIESLSPLDGYISTTAKPRADVILASDTDEPVLAAWQYGLGRTVAWTTDAAGMWTANWLADGTGEALLRNAVSWTLRRQDGGNVTLDVAMDGKDSVLTLTTALADNVTAVTGVLTGADGAEHALEFRAAAPGTFRAAVKDLEPGAYVAALALTTPEDAQHIPLGVSVSYPAEYDMRRLARGAELLAKIAETTGGRVLTTADDLYRTVTTASFAGVSVTNELLTAALVLLLIDIALRRFPGALNKLELLLGKWLKNTRTTAANLAAAGREFVQNAEKPKAIPPKTKEQKPKSIKTTPKAAETPNTSGALLAQKKKSGRR